AARRASASGRAPIFEGSSCVRSSLVITKARPGLITICYEQQKVSTCTDPLRRLVMNRSIKLGIVIATVSILLVMLPSVQKPAQSQSGATEAPAGFDNLTNGHINQADFDTFRTTFEEVETIADGLGPTFNNTSCAGCHNVPITGGSGK